MPSCKESPSYSGAGNNRRLAGHDALLLPGGRVSSFWQSAGYDVYWEGLVFASGIPSGPESVKVFVAELEKKGIEDACGMLKGIYFFVIESRKSGDIHAFIDNSGLYHAFYTPRRVSSSFLELARHEGLAASDFDPDAVVEFLHFGSLFSFGTYLPPIRRIRHDDIIRLSRQGGKLTFAKKNGTGICSPPDSPSVTFEQFFHETAASLCNRRVSIDLTGGVDTRLVAAMFDRCGLQFETASSGGTPEYEDISLSRPVARALGHPWFATIHSASGLERDMGDILLATDGLYDVLYYHRLYQLQKDRKKRGVDTMISGAGGELFKDFWWLHEFPFYRRGASDIERFVDMRVMSFGPMRGILTGAFDDAAFNLKRNLVRSFSQYALDTNTR
ncbi:MAG: asparagine synthase-related protein, partial [Nitrospiraceae bacterium]|nr:asparagine synthase-related protein [Nitrospiraceae bacterium]